MKKIFLTLATLAALTAGAQVTVDFAAGAMHGINPDMQHNVTAASRLQEDFTGSVSFSVGYTFGRLQLSAGPTRDLMGDQPVFFNTFAGYRFGGALSVMPFTGFSYMHKRSDYQGGHIRQGVQVMYWNNTRHDFPPFAVYLQAERTYRHTSVLFGFKTLLRTQNR